MPERRGDIASVPDDVVPQRAQRILQHHGDKRIVFDDQYPPGHLFPVIICEPLIPRS
jgi:hypothetical protein